MGVHGPILWRLATGAMRTAIVDDRRSWRGIDLVGGAAALCVGLVLTVGRRLR